MALSTGKILNNRYRIVKLLGQGGFGAVYRAWDLHLEKPCAIKENLETKPEAQRQFEREAMILAGLHHPNLPRVTDHFIENQRQHLVMDFVDGEDLEQLQLGLAAPLPEAQVIPWIEQICDALDYLHSQNPPIIHRDIKPANIKITPEGKAMLVDFSIAKVYDPHLKTTVGAQAVTPSFSPFEQYRRGTIDARTDIYALGATLYNLLTGKEPPESIQRINQDSLVPPSKYNLTISSHIESTIMRAMAIHPTERYQSIVEFKNNLVSASQIPATRMVSASPATSIPFPQTAYRPFSSLLVGLSLGILLLVAIFVIGFIGFPMIRPSNVTPTLPIIMPSISATAFLPTKTTDSDTNPVEIAVLNVKSETQPDGTIYTTADLSISPVGLGSLDFTSPATMRLGESGLVRLVITPDSALTSLPLATITPLSTNDPNNVLQFSDRLQIYPVMSAELKGVNFEIISDGHAEKPVTSTDMVEWVWSVTPKKSGRQSLVLIISIPVIIDQARDILSAHPLKNIPIEIMVEGTPTLELSDTPVPTPTILVPVSDRIRDQLIENSSSVFAAILVFISGLFTVYATIRSSMIQADVKSLREQLYKDVQEKEKLEKQIKYLESIRWWQICRKRKRKLKQ